MPHEDKDRYSRPKNDALPKRTLVGLSPEQVRARVMLAFQAPASSEPMRRKVRAKR